MTTSSHEHQTSRSFPAPFPSNTAQLASHQIPCAGRRPLRALASLIAIVCLCLSFCAPSLHAQGYGTISGTVSDPSGAVISGASVIATEVQTGNQTRTVSGKDGRFVFPTLLPSGYSLSVTAAGFESYSQTGIILEADQALTVNLILKIGAQTQTVSVTADAPQVDTTTGTLSQVINQESVGDLPLNGRGAATLVTLVAGVVDATNEGNGVNQGSGKTFSGSRKTFSPSQLTVVQVATVNGTLPNQDNFLLDGGNNLDEMTNVNDPYPMPDAVQEFSVQTSNYNAEFGQSAGAVVNIVTKSGGEQFHGDLFEYLRNGFFNAESHFSPTGTQDTLHRHQFGGSIGGPVKIPHISSGKTTQFFYGYQYTLIHTGSAASSYTAPTAAEEGTTGTGYADFSNLCNTSTLSFNGAGLCQTTATGVLAPTAQISNPFTGVAYPYNHIPTSAFDPASVAFAKFFPVQAADSAPGKIGNTQNYFSATQNYLNEDTARVDHEFGANDHMFARYFYDWYHAPAIYNPTDLESYTSYFQTRYQNALVAETHTFTANILNNLVLNFQREVSQRGGPPGSEDVTALAPGTPLASIWQPTVGPYLDPTISGYFKAASSASAVFERNNYTFNDDLHWVKGRHNFAFGGHYELSKFDVVNVYNSYGIFDFGLAGTSLPAGNVNAFANYMLGFMNEFEQGEYELDNDRGHFPGVYAQDSWKISSRLSLDYGLRWEMFAPWHDKVGVQTAFSPSEFAANTGTSQYAIATAPGTPGLPAGMVLSGDPGFPVNGVKNQYKQFMPRVGFAFDVFGNGKTALRGGYGIFYEDRMQGFFNLSQPTFQPNTITVGPNTNPDETAGSPGGPFSNPYCVTSTTVPCAAAGAITNPFPFTLPFGHNQIFQNDMEVGEYDPSGNFRVPVTSDYNLTVEQQLGGGMAMRLAYVGSASRHLFVNLELNPTVNTGVYSATTGKLTFPNGTSGAAARRVYDTAPTIGPCVNIVGCNENYGAIVEAAMIGSAHYNSLQATLTKRMSHGLQFLANYTWSKSYDDMPQATRDSNTEDLNSGESYVYPVYPANMSNAPAGAYAFPDVKALDRGLSDIDHPQVFSLSYEWAPAKLSHGGRVVEAIVNDWRTSGIFQSHSGDALTEYTGTDNSDTDLLQDRAQRDFTQSPYLVSKINAGDCPAAPKICENWLNPSAFSVPVNTGAGTGFGNVVKDTLRGPRYTVWNAGLVRAFPIYRESNLEFRMDYFDVLNHTILNNPGVSGPLSSSTSFGTITGENGAGPRVGQFSLKYNF
jgi:hypothetical protein